jgi:hypothetical protein
MGPRDEVVERKRPRAIHRRNRRAVDYHLHLHLAPAAAQQLNVDAGGVKDGELDRHPHLALRRALRITAAAARAAAARVQQEQQQQRGGSSHLL